jgi:nitrogen fixation NifU-like protein
MTLDLRELYQEMLIDHGRHPRNFSAMQDATHHAHGHNPLCGDALELFLKIKDQAIDQLSFQGQGCAISTASASMMTELLKGKSVSEAQRLFELFHDLLTTDHGTPAELGKLAILANVRAYPTRVKCATLAWHTLKAALQNNTKTVSTDDDS